jgi:tetratricopeptide (TPR) repeat protein
MQKYLIPIITFLLLTPVLPFSPIFAETDEVGEAYLKGDYNAVIELLDEKFSTGQTKIQERVILARSYLHTQNPEKAEEVLRSVLESDNENPEANALLGEILFEKQNYEEAIPLLQNALKRKDDPAVNSMLGQCYYHTGDSHQAVKYLKDALHKDPGNPVNGVLLGQIYLQRGYGLRAEQYLLKAVAAGQQGIDIERALGKAYLLQRKYTGPIVKRHIPEQKQPGNLLTDGMILKDLEEGKNMYLVASRYSSIFQGYQVLNLNPADLEALYMVCQGWLSFGDAQRAAEFLEQIKQQDASSKREALLEAKILLALQDFPALEQHLTRTAEQQLLTDKEITGWYFAIALALRSSGEKAQALTYLKKGEAFDPASGKIIRALAGLYRVLGNNDEARHYYSKYIELFPDAEDIDKMKNILNRL